VQPIKTPESGARAVLGVLFPFMGACAAARARRAARRRRPRAVWPAATISPYLLDDVDLAGMVEPAAAAVAEQKKKASEAKQA
jgi:hypothetical protein